MRFDLAEALMTTRTVRRGLDFDRPVDPAVLRHCVDLARFAPNGANRQDWRFVVIDEPALTAGIGRYYRKASAAYLEGSAIEGTSTGRAAAFLAERIDRAPALVLACLLGRLAEDAAPAKRSSFYGSIYPAVWSFMLAARSNGLGTALTTVHLAYEAEVADLLAIPFDEVTQVALLVVGHAEAGQSRPAARMPVDEILSHNRWRW